MIKVLDDFGSERSHNEEDEDEGKESFDGREYVYNKAIISLMLGHYEKSVELLQLLDQAMESGEAKEKLEFLMEMILNEKEISENKLKMDKQKSQEQDPKAFEIVIFDYYNRLSSIFPSVRLPFSSSTIYEARLSFCLPEVEPPSMAPCINEEIIGEVTMNSVDPRPEAPWIRRNFGGVIFTENFIDREEKEIENLNEVIKAKGLKAPDVYESLEKASPTQKTDGGESQKSSKQDFLNEAMIVENDSNLVRDKLLEPTLLSSDNIILQAPPSSKMKKRG